MAFLTEKGNLASAYKLLGQILEMQQQPALDAYKRSLDLDSSQNDVLLKGIVYTVCYSLVCQALMLNCCGLKTIYVLVEL